MSKKFIGSEGIKKIMDLGLKLFPNTEITSTEVNDMWNSLDKPAIEVGPESELDNWNYTLDEDNNTITLKTYKNTTATEAIVYGAYEKDGKMYNTNVTTTVNMFKNCTNLKEIKGLENLDTSKCTNMTDMFMGCTSLASLDLSSFDTSNVTNISSMFSNCTNLKEIKGLENLDTSNIENFGSMFRNCSSLTSLDLTSFDTSNVTGMTYMFYGCSSLTSLDLTSFDTSNINYFQNMFKNCTNLKEIKVSRSKWVIKSGCTTTDMFKNCGCSKVTYVD